MVTDVTIVIELVKQFHIYNNLLSLVREVPLTNIQGEGGPEDFLDPDTCIF